MNFLSPLLAFMFSIVGEPLPELSPPQIDYCSEMEQEIQGKKHAFLAGNKSYYIGGFHPVWNISENETIGLTHPFHNDLRCRGRGQVSHPDTGYGHDLSGWDFYINTRIAYGTVIINENRYVNPVPNSMIWRPDKVICEYFINGITINEQKFIDTNDVVCTIITSDFPIEIEFSGQSYADNKTVQTNAICQFVTPNNCIHITEGGIAEATPIRVNGQNITQTGPLMYDGMSTIISSSHQIQNYLQTDNNGQCFYTFTLPCDSNGVSLAWTMNDNFSEGLQNINQLLINPNSSMNSKTEYMNDILNNEIPYFRCSDQDIVDIYYYLWALQMMYMIDIGEGFETHPHTQTAVHNFLGLHRFDANFQIQVGSWAADKEKYANGNVLVWKSLLPFSNLETGRIPADNMGKAWYSGLEGSLAGHVVGAWKIYEHSGDKNFLQEAYSFYRNLMWNNIPGIWGYQYTAAEKLSKMASILNYPQSEINHWAEVVNANNFNNWLNSMWQKNGVTNYFGAGEQDNPEKPQWRRKGWSSFAYLALDDFPDSWARRMTEYWAMNSDYGFNLDGHFATTAKVDWDLIENKNFMITPDAHWFGIIGMYKHHVADHANTLTLHHLKNYNMKWGIPIAPEAIKETLELHGDQYSNFNAGKILLILEGIFGLSYSVINDSFTVAEHMPNDWSFMETYIPIVENGNKYWVYVKVTSDHLNNIDTRKIQVNGNRFSNLILEPWTENKIINSKSNGSFTNLTSGNIEYRINKSLSSLIEVELIDNNSESSTNNTDLTFLFNENFTNDDLDSSWLLDGDYHHGITNNNYAFYDIMDNQSTKISKNLSFYGNSSFLTSVDLKLHPFINPNTNSDFTWSLTGVDGALLININSYGKLQLRHNCYGENIYLLSEINNINYLDNQDIQLHIQYNHVLDTINAYYSINGGDIIEIYNGAGDSINGFNDVYSIKTSAELFKFNNDPSNHSVIFIDNWSLQLID
mgnify:CR=1 FL=1